jgi:hypothetical protein
MRQAYDVTMRSQFVLPETGEEQGHAVGYRVIADFSELHSQADKEKEIKRLLLPYHIYHGTEEGKAHLPKNAMGRYSTPRLDDKFSSIEVSSSEPYGSWPFDETIDIDTQFEFQLTAEFKAGMKTHSENEYFGEKVNHEQALKGFAKALESSNVDFRILSEMPSETPLN